jgi:hypothetical protein
MSGSERVLFLRTSSIAQEIGERLAGHSEDVLNVSGYIDNVGSQIKPAGGKALGQISDLQEIAADLEPDRIVVGMANPRNRLPLNQLLQRRQ